MDTSLTNHPVQNLAQAYGILPFYIGMDGNQYDAPTETLINHLQVMGVDSIDEPDVALGHLHEYYWSRWMEPVYVMTRQSIEATGCTLELRIPGALTDHDFEWELITEEGQRETGFFHIPHLTVVEPNHLHGQPVIKYAFTLPHSKELLPMGYHDFIIKDLKGGQSASTRIIVTPSQCYVSQEIEQGERFWGPAVQLYSLRSQNDWGMGDFTSLKKLAKWTQKQEGALIGLNPLNILNLTYPEGASPYSPNSRLYLNPLYIDVTAVPEFKTWEENATEKEKAELQALIEEVRETESVDYRGVARAKLPVLEGCYKIFKESVTAKSARGKSWAEFNKNGGETLRMFALFLAMQEAQEGAGWQQWPDELKYPSEATLKRYDTRSEYFIYLQWLCHNQLMAINEGKGSVELPIGLYLDLAVGSSGGGFDCWRYHTLYAQGVSVGAPPDPLGPAGQNWGFPPLIPHKLREAAYEPWIELLRHTMPYAGALRLDHVVGLHRLFWIPEGEHPSKGAYVTYNMDEILGIIALESHRRQCLVIGEDLGTVPDIVPEMMAQWHLMSYKVVRWERDWDKPGQHFTAPEDYPAVALVTPSTHDTPTLVGLVNSKLFDLLVEIGLMSPEDREKCRISNGDDVKVLVEDLHRRGLLDKSITLKDIQDACENPELGKPSPALQGFIDGVHKLMAQTKSAVAAFSFEDVLGMPKQMNIPGTSDADIISAEHLTYPNWRQKLPVAVEDLTKNKAVKSVVKIFQDERN